MMNTPLTVTSMKKTCCLLGMASLLMRMESTTTKMGVMLLTQAMRLVGA